MAKPETAAASGRKRPSKSVLIRLAIYVPLLGFFGWRAGARAIDERTAADAAFRTDVGVWLESPPGIVDLSNAIEVQGEAFLSAPPGETDTTGDETTGTETGTTSTTDTTDTTDTTGDTTGTTGEPAPDPATTTGTLPPP
jgi:hypothetical protein